MVKEVEGGNGKMGARAQWARSTKSPDESVGPFTRPFARLLVLLTYSFAPHCSLCSRAPLRSLVCSLAHFAHSRARGTVNDSMGVFALPVMRTHPMAIFSVFFFSFWTIVHARRLPLFPRFLFSIAS